MSTVHPTEPGYIMSLSLGENNYKVLAYFEDSSGAKHYLPSTIDSVARNKIRSLTYALFSAHDLHRSSQKQPTYDIKTVDANGLIKADNTLVTHDFFVADFTSPGMAKLMVDTLSGAGNPMPASEIKAQHIWDTMEEWVRNATGSRNSVHLDTTSNAVSMTAPTLTSSPVRALSMDVGLHASDTPDVVALDTSFSIESGPHTSMDADLEEQPLLTSTTSRNAAHNAAVSMEPSPRTTKLDLANWYEQILPDQKLKIIRDILKARGDTEINQKVWKHFGNLRGSAKGTIIQLLEQERDRLIDECETRETQSLIASLMEPSPHTSIPMRALGVPASTELTPPLSITHFGAIDFNQANWYAELPPRRKLKMVKDVLNISGDNEINKKVWKHFENLRGSTKTTITKLLEKERDRLILECQTLPFNISPIIRSLAELLIEDFYRDTPSEKFQEKINDLMARDFSDTEEKSVYFKKELFQHIYNQAIAKGIKIEPTDYNWAGEHYADDHRLFVKGLERWLVET